MVSCQHFLINTNIRWNYIDGQHTMYDKNLNHFNVINNKSHLTTRKLAISLVNAAILVRSVSYSPNFVVPLATKIPFHDK